MIVVARFPEIVDSSVNNHVSLSQHEHNQFGTDARRETH